MAEGKDIRKSDIGTRGVYLQTRYTGKQTWLFRWKLGAVSKAITLGDSPKMMLAEARRKAAEALDAVRAGATTLRHPSTARRRRLVSS